MNEICERQKKGMTDSCALCKEVNVAIYESCNTKGKGGE